MKVSSLGGVYKPHRGLTGLNWEGDLSWRDLHFPNSQTPQARLHGLSQSHDIQKFLLVVSIRVLIDPKVVFVPFSSLVLICGLVVFFIGQV